MQTPSDPVVHAVRVLFASWSKRPNEAEEQAWSIALRPHFHKPALKQALREMAENSEWLPSIPGILGKMRGIESGSQARPNAELTYEQRKRAERAAVFSALWLHYEFGWELEQHPMLVQLFGVDARAAAAAAKEQYSHATIQRWMCDQAAANPAPCDRSLGKHLVPV